MTGAPIKILVVDDEPPIRRLLRVGLSAQGYDVIEAADAAAASHQVKAETPDLIILDLGLPDRPGHELLQDWRAQGITAPVLILSSRTDEGCAHAVRPISHNSKNRHQRIGSVFL